MLSKKFNHNFIKTLKIEQKNSETGRKYVIEGDVAYPSITTVLGKTKDQTFLREWRKRVGVEKAQQITLAAAGRGTKMHDLCEKFLLNKELGELGYSKGELLFRTIMPSLIRFDNIRALEHGLVCHRVGIAGTVDCIAEVDGVLTVIDFKTSAKLKKEDWIEDYFIQGAFYFNAFHEMTGELPKQILILIAVEDGSLQEFYLKGADIIKYTKLLHSRKEAYDANQADYNL